MADVISYREINLGEEQAVCDLVKRVFVLQIMVKTV